MGLYIAWGVHLAEKVLGTLVVEFAIKNIKECVKCFQFINLDVPVTCLTLDYSYFLGNKY